MMIGCRSMMLFVSTHPNIQCQPIHPQKPSITPPKKYDITHHAATVRHGRSAARAAASCCASAAARSASSAFVAEGFFPLRLFGLTSLPPGPLTPPPAPDGPDGGGDGGCGCCGCLGLEAAAAVKSGAIAVVSIVVASDAAAGALPLTPTAAVGSRRRRRSAPVPRLANVWSMAMLL